MTPDNAKDVYNLMRSCFLDDEGWQSYYTAREMLDIDIYSHFPAEDNLGYFENSNGDKLLKWVEIAKFAECTYKELSGGYELLDKYTIDNNSPKYQLYQKELWPRVAENVITHIKSSDAYLLPNLFAQLTILRNKTQGDIAVTKDYLIDKVDAELKAVINDTDSRKQGSMYFSELELKTAFRNVIYNTSFPNDMLKVLNRKDNVLHDIYDFYARIDFNKSTFAPNDYYEIASQYLAKEEHRILCDKLYDKAKASYDTRLEVIKQMKPDKIIDCAYEIVIKEDVLSIFEYLDHFQTDDLKTLLSMDNPLEHVYSEWLDNDLGHMDDLRETVKYAIYEYNAENRFNVETEYTPDDGLEL